MFHKAVIFHSISHPCSCMELSRCMQDKSCSFLVIFLFSIFVACDMTILHLASFFDAEMY